MRHLIFFSYSHEDKKRLEDIQRMLTPLSENVPLWNDTDIKPGEKWLEEIKKALASTRVAVLLVSSHFLASKFIAGLELPSILDDAEKEGLIVLWIYVGPCMYKRTPIADYQALYAEEIPLNNLSKPKRDLILLDICEKIIDIYYDTKTENKLFQQRDPEEIGEAVVQQG
jgi:hypothetical protein